MTCTLILYERAESRLFYCREWIMPFVVSYLKYFVEITKKTVRLLASVPINDDLRNSEINIKLILLTKFVIDEKIILLRKSETCLYGTNASVPTVLAWNTYHVYFWVMSVSRYRPSTVWHHIQMQWSSTYDRSTYDRFRLTTNLLRTPNYWLAFILHLKFEIWNIWSFF